MATRVTYDPTSSPFWASNYVNYRYCRLKKAVVMFIPQSSKPVVIDRTNETIGNSGFTPANVSSLPSLGTPLHGSLLTAFNHEASAVSLSEAELREHPYFRENEVWKTVKHVVYPRYATFAYADPSAVTPTVRGSAPTGWRYCTTPWTANELLLVGIMPPVNPDTSLGSALTGYSRQTWKIRATVYFQFKHMKRSSTTVATSLPVPLVAPKPDPDNPHFGGKLVHDGDDDDDVVDEEYVDGSKEPLLKRTKSEAVTMSGLSLEEKKH